MSPAIRELRVLSTIRPLSVVYQSPRELMSLHCIRAPFVSRLTSLLTVCLWVSVLPSVQAEEVIESHDVLQKRLFSEYRFDPAFKTVMDALPSDFWDNYRETLDPPQSRNNQFPTGWLNYSASIFDGWGYYLERSITLSVQGLISIVLLVCSLLTTWWFVLPILGKYLRTVFKLCMMLVSVFSVSSFLYWMLKPSVEGYFTHRAPAVIEKYLETAQSAVYGPALFILSLIACLTLIEGIRNRAYISHQIQGLMASLSNIWSLLHSYSVRSGTSLTEDAGLSIVADAMNEAINNIEVEMKSQTRPEVFSLRALSRRQIQRIVAAVVNILEEEETTPGEAQLRYNRPRFQEELIHVCLDPARTADPVIGPEEPSWDVEVFNAYAKACLEEPDGGLAYIDPLLIPDLEEPEAIIASAMSADEVRAEWAKAIADEQF